MELVIMAGGLGSRFGGLKQLQEVDERGNCLVDYLVYDAKLAGFDKVIFVIRKSIFDEFRQKIGLKLERKIKIEYAFQETEIEFNQFVLSQNKPFGTGHALLSAKKFVTGNFACINADDFYGRESFEKIAKFLKNNKNSSKFALVGFEAKKTLSESGEVKRGIIQTKKGKLEKITESKILEKNGKIYAKNIEISETENITTEISPETLVSMNMFGLTPKALEFLETDFDLFLNEKVKHQLSQLKTSQNKSDVENEFLKTLEASNSESQENKKKTKFMFDEPVEYFLPSALAKMVDLGQAEIEIIKTNASWFGLTYREDLKLLTCSLKALTSEGVYPKNM